MIKKIILLAFVLSYGFTQAQTTVFSLFQDNMVLQQQENVSIWGNDTAKTKIVVSGSWGETNNVITDKDGNWKLKLKTPSAGGPYNLTIQGTKNITLKDVMIGEVWLCSGQSNMEMPVKGFSNQPINGSQEAILNSTNNNIRVFTVKRAASLTPITSVEGNWKIAAPANTGDFSASAYFFGKKLESTLNVPIGLIVTSWGGSLAEAWTDQETLTSIKNFKIPTEIVKGQTQHTPTVLYNAMLHPLVGFTLKGSIWYQGESNKNHADEYTNLINSMVTSWRKKWNQGDFSFYATQIAPFNYGPKVNSAFLREAQVKTSETLINSGMAVTLDIGDCSSIHPSEKRIVGERLAYWALAKDYKIQGIEFSGPQYDSMSVNTDGVITLLFKNSPTGITNFGKEIKGFEIAGDDKIFHPATLAKIEKNRNEMTLQSENVKKPVAVRYNFSNCIEAASIFSSAGLPASSFRTDDWAN